MLCFERGDVNSNEQCGHHQPRHTGRCVQGAALSETTKYVTISIGGNDLDFSGVILKCLTVVEVDIWPPGYQWRATRCALGVSHAWTQLPLNSWPCGRRSHHLKMADDDCVAHAVPHSTILTQQTAALQIRTAAAILAKVEVQCAL
jgi:hypothetical protein